MPDILVKPTRHSSPVPSDLYRKRRLSLAGIFFPLVWPNEKFVQFASSSKQSEMVHEIPSLEDYTKKEKDRCWYQKSEYRRMKVSRNLAEKQLGRGKPLPEDEDVACGLECPEDSNLRAICSVQSVRSVLIEQEIQKWETEGDPQKAIADVYFHSSFACRLDARERALRLERQVTPGRWLPETALRCNSSHSSSNDGDATSTTGHRGILRHPGDSRRNNNNSSSCNAPAMPIREESIRGSPNTCGFMPVRMPSFSESQYSESIGDDDDESEILDVSFHEADPPSSLSSVALPRLPKRRTSLGSSSSEEGEAHHNNNNQNHNHDDEDDSISETEEEEEEEEDSASWASAQRAASSVSLAGSLAM